MEAKPLKSLKIIHWNYFKVLLSLLIPCFLWGQFYLLIFLFLDFGLSRTCDAPWLLGHVDKRRASLISTGARLGLWA